MVRTIASYCMESWPNHRHLWSLFTFGMFWDGYFWLNSIDTVPFRVLTFGGRRWPTSSETSYRVSEFRFVCGGVSGSKGILSFG
uniref:Secreted protein n=1 Tax=Panagrellus redivivus TaxID=6233 RepID=A0A7E4USL6_PANRE